MRSPVSNAHSLTRQSGIEISALRFGLVTLMVCERGGSGGHVVGAPVCVSRDQSDKKKKKRETTICEPYELQVLLIVLRTQLSESTLPRVVFCFIDGRKCVGAQSQAKTPHDSFTCMTDCLWCVVYLTRLVLKWLKCDGCKCLVYIKRELCCVWGGRRGWRGACGTCLKLQVEWKRHLSKIAPSIICFVFVFFTALPWKYRLKSTRL